MAYNTWNNRIAMAWEYPLGTVEAVGAWLWLSAEPDKMSTNAETTNRRVYGDRYFRSPHLIVNKATPGGSLGSTPLWFEKSGTQVKVNRLLNSHFQNAYNFCPIPPNPCFSAHFPLDETTDELAGFSIVRDIGVGLSNAYVWSSCVCDQLEVSWHAGDVIRLTPNFKALNVNTNAPTPSIVATSTNFMGYLAQSPNIEMTWNGSRVLPASFKITSTNNMNMKFDHTSKQPVGMAMGWMEATLEVDVWVNSQFQSWYVPTYLNDGISPTQKLVEFDVVFYMNTDAVSGEDYYGTIHFNGKIIDIPSAHPAKNGLQKIKVQMVKPDGTEIGYLGAGYYIKLDSDTFDWKAVQI